MARDADLKRAKIQLAMRRAELKKAQAAAAPEAELQTLAAALAAAEQALHAAEDASGKPAPVLERIEKRPIAPQLRQLKTELAYARAELSKLQRQTDTSSEQLAQAQARLSEAERQVNAHDVP